MSQVLEEHRRYLADSARLGAFDSAIRQLVRPGDIVVDLGSGTGVLGLLACRAGASRVYSIESTALIGLAREICRANGFADRVTFIRENSRRVELPERADLVVADQIDGLGFEAGLFDYFADAHARFLKPGGKMIPARVDFIAAAVEQPDIRSKLDFWATEPFGFDLSAMWPAALNTEHFVEYSATDLLAPPAVIASFNTGEGLAYPVECRAEIVIERPGILHGIGGWFAALLADGVPLTNSPTAVGAIKRAQIFLPIERVVPVAQGDRVVVELQIVKADPMMNWKVSVCDDAGTESAASRHSSFKGMLVSSEDLRRQRPDFAPALSARGQARHAILELCDGSRPLTEIEAEILRRFPEQFDDSADASAFVAEVVAQSAA